MREERGEVGRERGDRGERGREREGLECEKII